MTKRFKLPIPIFTDTYITVVFTTNYGGFVKRNIREHWEEEMNDQGAFFTTSEGQDFIVFDITEFKQEDTIVHECVHAVTAILMHNGIWLTRENEETYAATIEYMFSKITEYWKKVKGQINKDGDKDTSRQGQVLPDVSGVAKPIVKV